MPPALPAALTAAFAATLPPRCPRWRLVVLPVSQPTPPPIAATPPPPPAWLALLGAGATPEGDGGLAAELRAMVLWAAERPCPSDGARDPARLVPLGGLWCALAWRVTVGEVAPSLLVSIHRRFSRTHAALRGTHFRCGAKISLRIGGSA